MRDHFISIRCNRWIRNVVFFFAGITTSKPQFDITKLQKLIEDVVTKYYANLCTLIENSLESIKNEMFQEGIISVDVQKNPKPDSILNSFMAGIRLRDTQSELEDYCKTFLQVLIRMKGSFEFIAKKFERDWLKAAQEISVQLSFI